MSSLNVVPLIILCSVRILTHQPISPLKRGMTKGHERAPRSIFFGLASDVWMTLRIWMFSITINLSVTLIESIA